VRKDYIWGTESWDIAAHPDGDTLVSQGPFAGRALSSLVSAFGAALLGPSATRFPLLFKRIDAFEKLSVQVHPSNATAAQAGGEPKTEMWHMLGGTGNATLYAGLLPGTTPDTLRAALDNGTAEQCLAELPATPGQSLFIPGGLVHAIGGGCHLYEVQQNSNTTYRLYDWNRTGADGNPRPLHIEAAFRAIDWTLPPPRLTAPTPTRTTPNAAWSDVGSCDDFNIRKLALCGHAAIPLDGTTFHVLFAEAGHATVEAGGESYPLATGASCLIPAAAAGYTLTGNATLLITTR